MRSDTRVDQAGRPWVPLSAGQLTARRALKRRQRRRRRAAVLGMMAVVIAAVVLVGVSTGGNGQTGAAEGRAAVRADHGQHAAHSRTPAGVHPPLADSIADRGASQHRQAGKVLAYTPYVRLAGHRRRDIALTFDDGPGPYTSKIISILRRNHAAATFFTIGEQVRSLPRLVATEARDGFEVGDHTETHAYLQEISATAQHEQIAGAAEAIRHAGAPEPSLFRPPYGSFDATTLSMLRRQGLVMVLWSVDTSDYARPGTAKIAHAALAGAAPGAIILMHDGGGDRSETAAALPKIIHRLRRRGFDLVTVSQLLAADPPPHGQPPPQPLSGLG
jgi:peptidoglycan/xylan/chitin deacetylase (PgdA/CDA1 family)